MVIVASTGPRSIEREEPGDLTTTNGGQRFYILRSP